MDNMAKQILIISVLLMTTVSFNATIPLTFKEDQLRFNRVREASGDEVRCLEI